MEIDPGDPLTLTLSLTLTRMEIDPGDPSLLVVLGFADIVVSDHPLCIVLACVSSSPVPATHTYAYMRNTHHGTYSRKQLYSKKE